jgi:hypothetical protein
MADHVVRLLVRKTAWGRYELVAGMGNADVNAEWRLGIERETPDEVLHRFSEAMTFLAKLESATR